MKSFGIGIVVIGLVLVLLQVPAVSAKNGSSQVVNAARIHFKNATSTNWSGYAVETNLANPQSNVVSDVKADWVVPTVKCTAINSYSSTWVGIDGYASNSVEQTGSDSDCSGGKATYYVWYEMYPKASVNIPMKVKAGDSISTEVSYKSSGFILILKDNTSGVNYQITKTLASAERSSAEWIVEAPYSGVILPLANFGTEKISNISTTIKNTTGTITNKNWQNNSIQMVNSAGKAKTTAPKLSADGSSFSISWQSM